MITGMLEHWKAQYHVDMDEYVLWGDIYEDAHGRFHDGTWIHTSGINKSEFPPRKLKQGDLVETRNSLYVLGEPA